MTFHQEPLPFRDVAPDQRAHPDRQHLTCCLTQSSDEQLMDHVARDNRQAFKILMQKHLQRTAGLARRILHSKSDAEDAAQEVFVNIWRKRESWPHWRSSFATWIYRITVHKCIDLNRARKHEPLEEEAELIAVRPDVISRMHAEEFSDLLKRALAQLSDSQQTVMALHYHEGLSAPQCSEILDMKLEAVEGLLKRGRKKLRDLMIREDALADPVELPAGASLLAAD